MDSPQIVAEEISQALAAKNMLADLRHGDYRFYVSDYTETFANIAKQFFGQDINLVQHSL